MVNFVYEVVTLEINGILSQKLISIFFLKIALMKIQIIIINNLFEYNLTLKKISKFLFRY